MSKLIQHWVTTYPKPILWIVGVILLLSGISSSRLQNDPTPEILPPTHESRVNLEELRRTFSGRREIIALMLENENGVFNRGTLTRIQQLTQAFRNIQVVTPADRAFLGQLRARSSGELARQLDVLADAPDADADAAREVLVTLLGQPPTSLSAEERADLSLYSHHLSPIIKIHSLADTENVVGTSDGLAVHAIYDRAPETADEQTRIQREVLGNDLLQNLLISSDAKRTGIYLETRLQVEDSKAAFSLYQQLREQIARLSGPERIYIAGTPVTTANISDVIDRDMGKLFPAVLTIILLCLWLVFRITRGILVPISVVSGAILITLGIQALFGIPINVLSASLPVYILCVGIGDSIHFISEYRTRCIGGMDRETSVRTTLQVLCLPIVLTSVTTAVAFFSLCWTQIIQIAHFGVLAGLGTLLALVLSLIYVPAILMVLPVPKASAKSNPRKAKTFDVLAGRLLERLQVVVRASPAGVLSAALLISGACIWLTTRVTVDNNRVEFFPSESEVAIGAKAIRTGLAGTETLDLIVESKEGEEPMKRIDTLEALDALEKHLLSNPYVGKTTSLASLIRRVNLVLHDGDPAYDRIPHASELVTGSDGQQHSVNGADLVSQYVLLYENGGGDLLRDAVDFSFQKASVRINIRSDSSNQVKAIMNDVAAFVSQHFPSHLHTRFSGTGYVLISAGQEIIFGQIRSFFGSMVLVLLILVVGFRSIVKGLVGMIPVLFATLLDFGLMGALGIPLDIGSALICSVAIGVGVDYGIHYLARLDYEVVNRSDLGEAIDATSRHSGVPIASNAMTVGVGFLALLVSDFVPINTIGWMVSLTMFSSCVATVVILPAVALLMRPQAGVQRTMGSRAG
ncbi:MAG: MMPL family transporter [Deltaproteobacteria bacterium]